MHPKVFYRDFFQENPPLSNAGHCFVAMPFASRFDSTYAAIKAATQTDDLGFKCSRADETVRGGIIMESVLKDIRDAEAIIFDLSSKRANVFYELGIASTIKSAHSIILISQDKPPFDVTAYRHFRYGIDALNQLQAYLTQSLREMTPARKKITIPIGTAYQSESRIAGKDDTFYNLSIEALEVGEAAATVRIDVWPTRQESQRTSIDKMLRMLKREHIPKINYAIKLHSATAEGIEICICDPTLDAA